MGIRSREGGEGDYLKQLLQALAQDIGLYLEGCRLAVPDDDAFPRFRPVERFVGDVEASSERGCRSNHFSKWNVFSWIRTSTFDSTGGILECALDGTVVWVILNRKEKMEFRDGSTILFRDSFYKLREAVGGSGLDVGHDFENIIAESSESLVVHNHVYVGVSSFMVLFWTSWSLAVAISSGLAI